ncbi:hypothetical protein TWF679_002486 [Orbilia oligospora]|uniref:Nephrocystin 3-like N-terminal domain-containing protein n=1 Tax=Orbilia oligospora TaxID=2813651 RepID=A0A8H8UTD1_ORBOL|nr:hypothetical protein TWF679_002486 [Orbilia oligospora]
MAGVVFTEVTASTSMLDEISIRPFSTISRRTTFPTKPPASKSSLPGLAPPVTRKSLFQCFEEARQTFEKRIVEPLTKSDPKRLSSIQEFLQGIKLDELGRVCRELSELAEDKANNKASKLLVTLDQFKGAGDALLQFAPESVSIVWFGISSLITIGSAKVQTRLLICGACDSIVNIVADCIRWESMAALMINEDQNLDDIWESDVPHLIFLILEFLWTAKPHFDQSRVKRIASNLKEIFNQELQERVTAILDKYEALVKTLQGHFQESMLESSFKTGEVVRQIRENLQSYVSIGVNLMSSLQKKALLDELDRQQAKLEHPASYKLHFSTLNDRLTRIVHDRNGRLAASWLFSEDEYCDWKTFHPGSSTESVNFLCLRGPRGHGKSVAMMSIHRDITKPILQCTLPDSEGVLITRDLRGHASGPPLVCHFFFKKGEQDIERSRSALESILYQLLGSDEIRGDLSVLTAAISILNPGFVEAGLTQSAESRGTNTRDVSGNFQDSLKSLCDTIKLIAAVILVPVYLMIDALDECIDRREQCFLECLKSLVDKYGFNGENSRTAGSNSTGVKSENLKLVISARDSVDIVGELVGKIENQDAEDVLENHGIKIVDITPEKNSSDLEEYLRHAIGEVLTRRIDREKYEAYYDSQLSRIVKIVHEKANGDFTLARLIIANLQQPSKETLEKRIKRLPSAIGDIYRASLESLTADEQEFVVAALKWVVWGVSGLSILEISDHYKEIYKDSGHSESKPSLDVGGSGTESVPEPNYASPYDNPEVKDTTYHIENAGRDFFKYDRNTGVVNVDISIREWIQQDISDSDSLVEDSRGFNKFRDNRGNTVFQFTLAPSFVRYGDTLSQLFNKKEAHMSIALDIFRALNNEEFQNKYMPWRPDWVEDIEIVFQDRKKPLRYEIEHWHDHILALQEWWTEDSVNSSWWAELLNQISIFTRPENWYRWNIQRIHLNTDEAVLVSGRESIHVPTSKQGPLEFLLRVFEEPIHYACKVGSYLLVDALAHQAKNSVQPSDHEKEDSKMVQSRRVEAIRTVRVQALIRDIITKRPGWAPLGVPSPLCVHVESGLFIWLKHHIALRRLVKDMGGEETLERLGRPGSGASPKLISVIVEQLTKNAFGLDNQGIISLVQEAAHVQSSQSAHKILCNREDILGRSPLCLASSNPLIIERLLKYGANINGSSILGLGHKISPLKSILEEAVPPHSRMIKPGLLKSAEILILGGADLKLEGDSERTTTCLHLAASLNDLKLFKLLYVSGDWDVHARDMSGKTPLHCLLRGRRPSTPEKIEDTLSIFKMIVKMKRLEEDLINMEDDAGRNVLAHAVQGGFIEAVEMLFDMGVNVHDEDFYGANCFHHLSRWSFDDDETNMKKIADVLLRSGLDYAKLNESGKTPLFCAAMTGKWYLARFFLSKYDELAKVSQETGNTNPLLSLTNGNRRTLFYAATQGAVTKAIGNQGIEQLDSIEFFKELNSVLSKYTDTASLILEPDSIGRTPLHIAVQGRCPQMVEMIVAINPDISHINHSLRSALDVAMYNLAKTWIEIPSPGNSDSKAALKPAVKIVRCLESHSGSVLSQFPFSFFKASVHSSPEATILNNSILASVHPETRDLIDRYDSACKQLHGWHLFEYAMKVDLIFPEGGRYSGRERLLSPPSEFARPTRIGWTSCPMELSNDALEVLSTGRDSRLYLRLRRIFLLNDVRKNLGSKLNQYQFVIPDHPVPPIDAGFYFEVTLNSELSDFELSGVFCEIGIRCPTALRAPEVACDLFDGSVSYHNIYQFDWPYKIGSEYAPQEIEEGASNPFTDTKYRCFGCGMNPVYHGIFFTVDGAVVFTAQVLPDIYYPFFGFSNYSSSFKINFGAEKFMFELANKQDWGLEVDWREGRISWDNDPTVDDRFSHRRFTEPDLW